MKGKNEMRKQRLLYLFAIAMVLVIVLISCESPTAVKERKKDTTIIRDDNGRK